MYRYMLRKKGRFLLFLVLLVICLMESLVSFVGAAAICIALQPAVLILMVFLALLSMWVTRLTTAPLEKSMEGFVEAAVEQAGLKELADSLQEGLSTLIGENGKNFSGGEKQRLGLARALLRKSRVLLLDEFTANLDKETAKKLESRILALEGCLTITVTHRL